MSKSCLHLVAMAHRHVELEVAGELETLMETLDENPVYDFHPACRRFSGVATTRAYYEHFIAEVLPRIAEARHKGEWIGPDGVVEDYVLRVTHPHGKPPTTHRIMTVLTFGEERLSGERMYADDALFEVMCGPLWDRMERIEPA